MAIRDPTVNGEVQSEALIPVGSTQKGVSSNSGDQLDKAGQSIFGLLAKAAGVGEENSRCAQVARKIAELEAELETYGNRTEHAERWLHKAYTEIEDRFCDKGGKWQARLGWRENTLRALMNATFADIDCCTLAEVTKPNMCLQASTNCLIVIPKPELTH